MMTAALEMLQSVFLGLCLLSLRATILLGVFAVSYRVAGPWLSARWRYALWGLLPLSMVLPWGIAVPLHAAPTADWANLPVTREAPNEDPPEQALPSPPTDGGMEGASIKITGRLTANPTARRAPWLAFIWIAGAVYLLLRLRVKSARLRARMLDDAIAVPHAVRDVFEDARNAMAPRRWPALIVTEHVSTPALLGAIRPKVLLPRTLVEQATPGELRHLFLHELAHLRRGDIWANWLWSLALALHWFNPMLWWAGHRIARDREVACDESVLAKLNSTGQRLDYGGTLLSLARCTGPFRRNAGWVGILENQPVLERRIAMIANYRPHTWRHGMTGLLVLSLLGAFALVSLADDTESSLGAEDAELMGRVEYFLLHNYRDVTARKSVDWGKAEVDDEGNRSIRYQYVATIWDKEMKLMNQCFTFDAKGKFVKVEHIDGSPKAMEQKTHDTATNAGMRKLVEHFFSRNYRDITARKTLEWGTAYTDDAGNRCIRYKYQATIWDKDVVVQDKIFTFTPEGGFVSAMEVTESGEANEMKARIEAVGYSAQPNETKARIETLGYGSE